MRSSARFALTACFLAIVLPACANFEQDETERPEPQPGIDESQHDLDSELCWQEIGVDSDEDVMRSGAYDQAHAECMRKKGWTDGE